MAWDDLNDVEHRLTVALQSYDWEGVTTICQKIVERVPTEPAFPDKEAKRIMGNLRRKRRFADMGLLAEALLQSGLQTNQIRRQYAQALIDQGMLTGAELVLKELIQDPLTNKGERSEALGLLGRIYKQLYVNAKGKVVSERSKANLQQSFDNYAAAYDTDPEKYTWQGINMAALLARAKADNVSVKSLADDRAIASKVLATLDAREAEATELTPAWDLATRMEAYVALGDFDKAYQTARIYADAPDADAFEIASTLRQLQEVWRLENDVAPGSILIPMLRAAQCAREGGGMTVPLREARQDIGKGQQLEKVFGVDKSRSLKWYQEGLERAKSVCRIELADGRGFGTGWLVKSTDFFPNRPLRPLVLTNAHVISTTAQKPPDVWANFQLADKRLQIKSIVWSSPITALDATFVDLVEDLGCDPMPLYPAPMELAEPGPRMYIVGHPGGRDLEFSLNDNRLIGCSAEKLHYRTPTEAGSSGSPVFDPAGWKVVGLHHAGRAQMPKLGGKPGEVYEANEGIAILAIQQKTRVATG